MMVLPEGFVPVRDAARLARVHPSRVHAWIRRGKLRAWVGLQGRLVSPEEVQALAAALEWAAPAADDRVLPGDYVPLYVAARLVRASLQQVTAWASSGAVSRRSSPYGHLVRVADVQDLAGAEVDPARDGDGGPEAAVPEPTLERAGPRLIGGPRGDDDGDL